MRERETPSDLVRLQTELLRFKARLYDPNTKLPTLPIAMDRILQMLNQHETMQVFMLRIEQEQLLEGVVGWEVYDQLMSSAAQYLHNLVGGSEENDAVLCQENVRGDIFVIFAANAALGGRIQDAIADGIPVMTSDDADHTMFPVRIGLGRAWRSPAMRLERCVYNAMLEARQDFHLRGQLLDEGRRQELRSILKNRTIRTLFQPILRLDGLEVEAFEALSRGPEGSYLESAENLFGFTERAGMLGEVEQLCVEQALINAQRLPPDATLFVNLSIHGLEYLETAGGGLAQVVRTADRKPTDFVLEITERTYADNPEHLRNRVETLRDQGFRIAIDDMGTGFSSLNVLTELEPEYIKLDHSLVRDLANKPIKRNLVAAISNFATASNSLVIAEGVECQHDMDALTTLGIGLVQGFFFGRPQPAPAG